ncbi:MAG: hypothetical protein ACP5MB_11170 [bacterium]
MAQKNLFGEVVSGLILSFVVVFLAPLGFVADFLLSAVFLILLVPISKALLNSLSRNKIQIKLIVKYAAGLLMILVVSIGETFAPLEAGAWIILGTIIYIFFDDIQEYLQKKGWAL